MPVVKSRFSVAPAQAEITDMGSGHAVWSSQPGAPSSVFE
jgi:hypothetical protein